MEDYKKSLIIKPIIFVCFVVVLCSFVLIFTFDEDKQLAASAEDSTIYDDYIPISTAEELNYVRNNLSGKYYLKNDISLLNEDWIPLGTFTGIFDGKGYTISNLKTSTGFFSINNGTIRNVYFSNVSISYNITSGDCNIGVVCGSNNGKILHITANEQISLDTSGGNSVSLGVISGLNSGTIKNCTTKAYVRNDCYYNAYSGGIAGNNSSIIEFCYSYSNIYSFSTQGFSFAGGIVGNASGNVQYCEVKNSTIRASTNSSLFSSSCGGIAGYLNSGSTISNCVAIEINCVSNATKWNSFAGGICGWNKAYINHCFSSGSLSANNNSIDATCSSGGIAAINYGSIHYSIVSNISAKANNQRYDNDKVLDSNGTIVAWNAAGDISECFYNNVSLANTDMSSYNGKNITSSEMISKLSSLFSNTYWDITNPPRLINNTPIIIYDKLQTFSINHNSLQIAQVKNASKILLNNEVMTTNYITVSNVGKHILTVFGFDDYCREITIIAKPNITSISNGSTYYNAVTPTIFGTCSSISLNSKSYINGTELNEVGNYSLKVLGINNYIEELFFTISPTISGVEDSIQYYGAITPIISGGTLFLNGMPYTSGTPITDVGMYSLCITGTNNYSKTVHFAILPEINGIIDQGVYFGNVTPSIIGNCEVFLNRTSYTFGTEINTIGNNIIEIRGTNNYMKQIAFVINPICNVDNEGTYYKCITPILSGGTLYLNDEPFISGTEITSIGAYSLVIEGINGYLKTISFIILPIIEGIIDKAEYYEDVNPIIDGFCTIELNGEPFIRDKAITMPGSHILRITGVGGYEKVIEFTLDVVIEGVTHEGVYDHEISPHISGGLLYINGQPYDNDTAINSVGYNVLSVLGVNGFYQEIEFTILPIIENLENGKEYLGEIQPHILGGTITLNGQDYDGNAVINMPGEHQIRIFGVGNYIQQIVFFVQPSIQGVVENGTYSAGLVPEISGGIIKLNGNIYNQGDKIVLPGSQILTIEGVNGYQKTIHFSIVPIIQGVYNNANYLKTVRPTIEGGIITLNGALYDNSEISMPGQHEIIIEGVNGYSQTIRFFITPIVSGFIDKGVTTDNVKPIFSGGTITVNGESFVSGTTITEVGEYDVVLMGVNGYKQEYSFTIIPIQYEVASTVNYYTFLIKAIHEKTTIKYDGNLITENFSITEVGNHVIQIENESRYQKTLEITVKGDVKISDNQVVNKPFNIKKQNAKMFLDGQEIIRDTLVDKNGKHTLKIIGANGYEETIVFTYNNPYYLYLPYIASLGGFLFVIVLALVITRRKRL